MCTPVKLRAVVRTLCVIFLPSAAFVGGCATSTSQGEVNPPIDVPMQWAGANPHSGSQATGTASNVALGQWWQHFNDPLLTTLVVDALQANTTVQGAQASLMQARALKQVAGATLLPALGSSIVAQRNGNHDTTVDSVRAALDASWEVDIFGTNRSGVRASDATEKATTANLADIQVSVSAEVALNYISLRSTQMRLALARSSLASQQETLEITQWRQQAGLVTVLDTAQASAALEQTRAQIPLLEITLVQTSHALAVLTGRPPADLLTTLAAPGAVPQTVGEPALSFPADTLRQRPDIRAAEFQVAAGLARVDQAQAARLPNFKIGGSLGLSAASLAALADGTALTTGLLASVVLPLSSAALPIEVAQDLGHLVLLDQYQLAG